MKNVVRTQKRVFLFFVMLFLGVGFLISSVDAWRSCDNAGTCMECNPDVLTHCEEIDKPVNSNTVNNPFSGTCTDPSTPGCASNSSDNNQNSSVVNTQEKPAYLYIKYKDIAGRDIYNIPTYKGIHGEVVDLSEYKKYLSTFEFVRYEPKEKITLVGGKSLSAKLIYKKAYRTIQDSSINKKRINQADTTDSIHSNGKANPVRVKMFSSVLKKSFEKQNIKGEKKTKMLEKLKTTVQVLLLQTKKAEQKEILESLLEAIEEVRK